MMKMQGVPPRSTSSSGLLTPGPRFLAIDLLALPPAVVALSSTGTTQQVSGLFAVLWFALVPLALYGRWATVALPFVAAAFVALTVVAVPFNSGAFWTNTGTAAIMLLASLPRRAPEPTARSFSSASIN